MDEQIENYLRSKGKNPEEYKVMHGMVVPKYL